MTVIITKIETGEWVFSVAGNGWARLCDAHCTEKQAIMEARSYDQYRYCPIVVDQPMQDNEAHLETVTYVASHGDIEECDGLVRVIHEGILEVRLVTAKQLPDSIPLTFHNLMLIYPRAIRVRSRVKPEDIAEIDKELLWQRILAHNEEPLEFDKERLKWASQERLRNLWANPTNPELCW